MTDRAPYETAASHGSADLSGRPRAERRRLRLTVKVLLLGTAIGIFTIFLFSRTLLFEPFNIPSSAMMPTLVVGDFLFVSKYAYGYSRHSLPFSSALFEGRILAGEPERGDVVVFKLPRDNKTDFIKRIVGLPGDRIQMIDGILNINGEPVQRERVDDYYSDGGRCSPCLQYIETLPGGRRISTIEQSDNAPRDNTEEYLVPPGHYFGLGDNRDNSDDSRGIVGFIPAENLVGRAEILFLSVDANAPEPATWAEMVRWDRIFDRIR
jgi:signal peptidase I